MARTDAARRRRNRLRNLRRKHSSPKGPQGLLTVPSTAECQERIVDVLGQLQAEIIRTAFELLNTQETARSFWCPDCRRIHTVEFSYTRNRHGGLDHREAIVDGRVLYSHLVI